MYDVTLLLLIYELFFCNFPGRRCLLYVNRMEATEVL